ncbi:MAG TPA: response regulator transcription factor [Candidatus Brocadiia bacterium]|nr:response regulator transcription factor [Candidatus Brocadiia bacterium]
MFVLIAEDNERLADFIRQGLQEKGMSVDVVHDGEAAAQMARSGVYHVIVLDIMLPLRSGFDVIRKLRGDGVKTPIICLTARDGVEDKVTGLELGADDYLAKPFDFAELVARIRALGRRSPDMVPQKLACGDLILDPVNGEVTRQGTRIELTPKEFTLLEFLMRRQGTIVTRTSIVQNVWDMNFDSLTNVVEVFMNRLRNKIDYPFQKRLLSTIRGRGYRLSDGEPQE